MSESDRPRCQKRIVSSIALAARLLAGDDLAEFGVDGRFADEPGIDMRPQRAEFAGAELAEIVDDDLVHDRRSCDSSSALTVP